MSISLPLLADQVAQLAEEQAPQVQLVAPVDLLRQREALVEAAQDPAAGLVELRY